MPFRGDRPMNKVIIKSTRKIKNKTRAMEAEAAAIPPNPNRAATSAITKNITVQRNIINSPCYLIIKKEKFMPQKLRRSFFLKMIKWGIFSHLFPH